MIDLWFISNDNRNLMNTKSQAHYLFRKIFSSGFRLINRKSILKNQIWKFKFRPSIRTFFGIINGFEILWV